MAMAWTAIPDRIVLQDEYENSRLFLWLKLPICGVLMGTMVSVLTAALMSVQEQAAAAVVALVCTTLATYGLRKCGSGTKHTLLPNTDRDEGYDLTPPENNAENHARVATSFQACAQWLASRAVDRKSRPLHCPILSE